MQVHDIAIVGAGPAGLSAALYAARFCRSTIVLHDGASRAARIPKTYNAPGFDEGVEGNALLKRMTNHAIRFGAEFVEARIVDARKTVSGFVLTDAEDHSWAARALILATGINLNQIALDTDKHERAIASGVLRYCPVCDGYEHKSARIGVVGCDVSGAAEALFLRQFTDDVTLLPMKDVELSARDRRDLDAAGVKTVTAPITGYDPGDDIMSVSIEGRAAPLSFDVLYPALGVTPRSELAKCLGLGLTDAGKTKSESIFGCEIAGLYCAGDVVEGLDQISVAMGHGAIAATKAHNWLRERDGETIEAVLDVQPST